MASHMQCFHSARKEVCVIECWNWFLEETWQVVGKLAYMEKSLMMGSRKHLKY